MGGDPAAGRVRARRARGRGAAAVRRGAVVGGARRSDPLEQMVDRPLVRLLRPVIARRMRSKPRRPEPLPEPNEGPFASVVAALEGSPAAGVLRRAIDGALASPVLPRRTKMLLFAVVA